MKKNKDKTPISEKIDDTIEEIVVETQNAIYGERKSMAEDIPATIVKDNGIRKINKVQTRRNINKKLFKNKTIISIIIAIAVFGLVSTLFYNIVFKLLMK